MSEHKPDVPTTPSAIEAPEPHPATEGSEAEGFVR